MHYSELDGVRLSLSLLYALDISPSFSVVCSLSLALLFALDMVRVRYFFSEWFYFVLTGLRVAHEDPVSYCKGLKHGVSN